MHPSLPLAFIATLCVVLQAALLFEGSGSKGPWWASLGFPLVLGLFVGAVTFARRRHPRPLLDMMLITACVGGAGMLLGGMIDDWVAPPSVNLDVPPCHRNLADTSTEVQTAPWSWSTWSTWASWMNLVMLAVCVPACALLCRPCAGSSRATHWLVHGACAVGMMLGMFAGGALLGPSLENVLGPRLGMHVAMVLGMVMGVAAGWPILRLTR